MSPTCAARVARLCIVIAGATLVVDAAEAQVRTILISPTPGASPTTNGARLLTRYAAITDASATNPYLVKIEPGIFDFKDRSLIMRPFIDIEGSGEGVTTLRSLVESAGTVAGGSDTELRLLTIENTATSNAVALRNASPAFSARHVTCVATNASFATAILQGSASDVTLRSVTARATGFSATGIHLAGGLLVDAVAQVIAGDLAYAVFNQSSNGELVNVTAEADSRRFAGGIRNEAGAPILRTIRVFAHGDSIAEGIVNGNATGAQIHGAVVRATGGSTALGVSNEFTSGFIGQADITADASTFAIGVSNQFRGSPTLQDVRIRAAAGGHGIGVGTDNGVTSSILNSDIQGDDASVANNPGATAVTRVGSSRLTGPVRPGTGTMACAASYNGSFTPLGPTCVP